MLSFGGGLFCLIWALIGANRVGWSAEETLAEALGVRCPVRALRRG